MTATAHAPHLSGSNPDVPAFTPHPGECRGGTLRRRGLPRV